MDLQKSSLISVFYLCGTVLAKQVMSLRAALRWSVTIVGEDDEAVFKASSERLQVLFGAFSAEDDDAARLPQTIQLLSVEKTMEKKQNKRKQRDRSVMKCRRRPKKRARLSVQEFACRLSLQACVFIEFGGEKEQQTLFFSSLFPFLPYCVW